MEDKGIKEMIEKASKNIICSKLCMFPNQIASFIDKVSEGDGEYGVVLIGVDKIGEQLHFLGIDRKISQSMDKIILDAITQVKNKAVIEDHGMHCINNHRIYAIKVKTSKMKKLSKTDQLKIDSVLRDLLNACIKLQGNSLYNYATENQRNDFIRDLMETSGYDVKDQTRRGLSHAGKEAGELDILIKEDGFPVSIVEALNLDSLNTNYLSLHINKIFDYDTAGNQFNIILSYVKVNDFNKFIGKYNRYVEMFKYPYPLISSQFDYKIEDIKYSDLKIIKTVLNRNNTEINLFHICLSINTR